MDEAKIKIYKVLRSMFGIGVAKKIMGFILSTDAPKYFRMSQYEKTNDQNTG